MAPLQSSIDLTSSPIFVVGYMHSGTTLLREALGRHPEVILSGGETKFFEYFPLIRDRFSDLSSREGLASFARFSLRCIRKGYPKGKDFSQGTFALEEGDEEIVDFLVGKYHRRAVTWEIVFRDAFDEVARRRGFRRWLEKTPFHVFSIPQIWAAYPDALFVEIVRDPRDILASKKTRRKSVWRPDRYGADLRQYKHLERTYDPLWDSFSWRSAIKAGRSAHATLGRRIVTVRYEDLVRQPEETLRHVCEVLALTFEIGMLDVSRRNLAVSRTAEGRGFKTDSLGRWQGVLSGSEVAICEWLTSREMDELGYEASAPPSFIRMSAAAYLPASAIKLFVYLFRRWKMGGHRFLLNILSSYWTRMQILVRANAGNS